MTEKYKTFIRCWKEEKAYDSTGIIKPAMFRPDWNYNPESENVEISNQYLGEDKESLRFMLNLFPNSCGAAFGDYKKTRKLFEDSKAANLAQDRDDVSEFDDQLSNYVFFEYPPVPVEDNPYHWTLFISKKLCIYKGERCHSVLKAIVAIISQNCYVKRWKEIDLSKCS